MRELVESQLLLFSNNEQLYSQISATAELNSPQNKVSEKDEAVPPIQMIDTSVGGKAKSNRASSTASEMPSCPDHFYLRL